MGEDDGVRVYNVRIKFEMSSNIDDKKNAKEVKNKERQYIFFLLLRRRRRRRR